jgi:hypothetical protein
LTKTFIEANIPLEKLSHPSLRQFLQKYTKRDVPNPFTLRKNYVSKIYENVIAKVRAVLADYPIYLIVDETTDAKNRYVVNIMVGSLNGRQSKPMLISTTFVDQTNNKTINQCIMDSLRVIWPENMHYDRLWLIL